MTKRIKLFLAICVCAALSGCSAAAKNNTDAAEPTTLPTTPIVRAVSETGQNGDAGYRAALYNSADDTFLAAGTGGRLDRINGMKQVQNIKLPTDADLLCTGFDEKIALFGGANGTMIFTDDGQTFETVDTGIDTDILSVAAFKGAYFAGSEGGVLLKSFDGRTWEKKRFEDKKNIISIAATSGYILAITKDTDIYVSKDGLNWTFQNFNEVNGALYDAYDFKGVRALGSVFAVFGNVRGQEDSPLLMLSEPGDIWSIKPLAEIDFGEDEHIPARINAVTSSLDQMYTACDLGGILTVTSCYKCNIMTKFAESNIREIVLGNGALFIGGDNFEFDILDPSSARQFDIAPEQAVSDVENGAVLIDVRTKEEFDEKHIAGSIHMPVDQVGLVLPEMGLDPMTELIFYCASGQRSQTALETARAIGFDIVYNLGGISDWPYETE